MTSLRSILAFNMKDYRSSLGISQARLAERVNTSTNYIALIETEKRFPTPEMLERIAAALEVDPAALFATKDRLQAEPATLARFQKQLLSDVSKAISAQFKKFEQETPPDRSGADAGEGGGDTESRH